MTRTIDAEFHIVFACFCVMFVFLWRFEIVLWQKLRFFTSALGTGGNGEDSFSGDTDGDKIFETVVTVWDADSNHGDGVGMWTKVVPVQLSAL